MPAASAALAEEPAQLLDHAQQLDELADVSVSFTDVEDAADPDSEDEAALDAADLSPAEAEGSEVSEVSEHGGIASVLRVLIAMMRT